MNEYHVSLPFPPSVNRWVRVARGRIIKSKEWRTWIEGTGMVLHETYIQDEPIAISCSVTIHLEPPNRRRFDIDNRAKAVLDSLEQHNVLANDDLVDSLLITRGDIHPGGRALVGVKW